MADEVPDLLQPELGVDEPLHERVAQGVGPEPRRLHPGPQEVTPGAGGNGVRPDGPNGGLLTFPWAARLGLLSCSVDG